MKIVFLDAKSVGEDIDLSKFEQLGEFISYDFTHYEDIKNRISNASRMLNVFGKDFALDVPVFRK